MGFSKMTILYVHDVAYMEARRCFALHSLLIERYRCVEEGVDNIGVVVELLVDHQCKDAHLCGATVVQLDPSLAPLLRFRPFVCVHVSLAIILDGLLYFTKAELQGPNK